MMYDHTQKIPHFENNKLIKKWTFTTDNISKAYVTNDSQTSTSKTPIYPQGPQPKNPKLTTTANQPLMAPKFHILLLILSLSFIPAQLSDITVGRKAMVGGWKPIKNPKDPVIQEIGKFAVTTYNKDSKNNLEYQNVVKGQTQVAAGTNYRLTIVAKDKSAANHYEAIVFDQPWTHTRNLTSFKRLQKLF